MEAKNEGRNVMGRGEEGGGPFIIIEEKIKRGVYVSGGNNAVDFYCCDQRLFQEGSGVSTNLNL